MSLSKYERIFKKWLDEHRNLIFRVVRAYAYLGEDQDDLFQEILMQIWSSIAAFRGDAAETTWIYRIALNTALVWQRSQTRRRRRHHRFIAHLDKASGMQVNCSEPLSSEQIVEGLYSAVRQLPKIDGSLILMHLDGLSYQQMADVLGITKTNVGVKLNRAKKQLAQLLKGLIDDF
ncbi:MAG: RNA polymerase sigma factor [Planctomycetota bacterium]